MVRQGLPCTKHVTPCLEGREADLISINCEWPAGMLGPHMVFWCLIPEDLQSGQCGDGQVHTIAVK